MFKKVLIANRGEIALRIHRACQDMGIKTVAVHSKADADAMHVRLADEAVCIGPASATESYLNIQSILAAAEVTGAEAIHPGYGFLSENATFARIVEEHGMVFIGPKPDHITLMGDKITGKKTVEELGIPVVPGSNGAVETTEDAIKASNAMGYPVLIKATAGGGGKGMHVAHNDADVRDKYILTRNEARANFGNDEVFIEKFLGRPRHIEVQILADDYGNVVHLGERDCSVQRRHQKVWEEAPSPVITEKQRHDIGMRCANAMKKLGYRGLGTVEFLYEDGQFFFIEMNTRVQVEHPVTETVTGIDLVREQIRVAAGEALNVTQNDIKINGHAIECRINAEDSETFIPSPGKIDFNHPPGGYGVRVDSAIYTGYRIPPHYDSLIAKLIVWGHDRHECIIRTRRALSEYIISGVNTTIPLHKKISRDEKMVKGDYTIHWLEREFLKK